MLYENVDLTRVYDDNNQFPVGAIHRENGAEFEFVKYHHGDGPVNATAGHVGYYCSSGTETVGDFTVTEDHDADTTVNTAYTQVAGMFMSALTEDKCGWIQKKGYNRVAMLTDTNVTDKGIVCAADADGTIRPMVNTDVGSHLGLSMVADSAAVAAIGSIKLCIPYQSNNVG